MARAATSQATQTISADPIVPAAEQVGRRGRVRAIAPDLGPIDAALDDPVERQVYGRIKQAIMSGLFPPGASITSRSLAERFGVSPTPVREALKRLEAHGVLESRQKSAYFVTMLSRESYMELAEVRSRIEGYAVAEAAKVIGPDTIRYLEQLNAAEDAPGGLANNHAFHFTIYRVAASTLLLELIENCWMRVGPALHLYLLDAGAAKFFDNHTALIEALARHDPRAAERALRKDILDAARGIAPHLPPNAARPGSLPTPSLALSPEDPAP